MLGRMALDMVKDAEMKARRIQSYRESYSKSREFKVAELVYIIREKFKKILIMYQNTDRNITRGRLYHGENLDTLAKIQKEGMDIDNMGMMLEEFLIKREQKGDIHKRMRIVIRKGDGFDEENSLRSSMMRLMPRPSDYYVPRPHNSTRSRPRRKNGKWEYMPTNNQF
ncbi:unnamed protein product [Chrysodeixis includens]|uniref:Uncharacterized protein n=1 Tax=Chrysodeixis includens TaxID=689277 RepID=A0A9P0BVT2_CHRIL|nr:unnamed protein product [Chrysodeixis includens]